MSAQRFYGGSVEELGDREIGVIAATSQLARDGHVIDVRGIDLTNYRKVPIVLWQHSPQQPIGTCTAIGVEGDVLAAKIEFAPPGISTVADQACAMAKAGVIRGISIGYDPDLTTAKPLDPKRPYGGQRYSHSELLELSLVSIPADVGATVVARTFASRADFQRMIDRLTPVGRPGIERAAALLPKRRDGRLLSHAGHVWTILEANRQRDAERAKRYSFEQRQAELRELGKYTTH
jgi:uncharacterized protein